MKRKYDQNDFTTCLDGTTRCSDSKRGGRAINGNSMSFMCRHSHANTCYYRGSVTRRRRRNHGGGGCHIHTPGRIRVSRGIFFLETTPPGVKQSVRTIHVESWGGGGGQSNVRYPLYTPFHPVPLSFHREKFKSRGDGQVYELCEMCRFQRRVNVHGSLSAHNVK